METKDEIIKAISSARSHEEGAARALEAARQGDEQALLELLEHYAWEVRTRVAMALGELGDRGVAPVLKARLLSERDNDATREIAKALERLVPPAELVAALKEALATNKSDSPIGEIIRALQDKGVGAGEMSRFLLRNPAIRSWSARDWAWALERPWTGTVVEDMLRRYWWRLPLQVRRHLDWPWWPLDWHPEGEMLVHRLLETLEHHRPHRWEVERLIAVMKRWWGFPRWHFAHQDFESLMSFRVEENVTYEEVNSLRFRFLGTFGTDREGRPIGEWARRWLGEFQQDWDELLRTEEQFDRVRDEIANLRHRQAEILREGERRAEGERRVQEGEPPPLPQDLQERWDQIVERLQPLEGNEEPGVLQRLRGRLEEATLRLMPRLRDGGVGFPVIEVEGVLGEYDSFQRTVVLYPPMIALAAGDLSPALGLPPDEVEVLVTTLTEMHEVAHATAHLGLDSEGRLWERPQEATADLHELLAQLYTFHLVRRLADDSLERVFRELNARQTQRYRLWELFQDLPLEEARRVLVQARTARLEGDVLSLASEAVATLQAALPLLQRILPKAQLEALGASLGAAAASVQGAATRRALAEAAEGLMAALQQHPVVCSLLAPALPGGFPSPARRKLLLAATLTEGLPVRAPTLRLTMQQIEAARAAALRQNDLIRQNEIVRGLRALDQLRAAAGAPNGKQG